MESQDSERKVNIRLHSSIQHPGQDEEVHELKLLGQLIEKKGKSYLRYEEQQSGNLIRTTVKLDAEDALIMRKGAVNMRLPFVVAAEDRAGSYGNGPASFNLIVKTHRLEHKEEQGGTGGEFKVHYGLHADGSPLGTYKLTITYREGTL
ncbi:DUF1934 domain-containing protein [Sporosarcina limicola]|uniref:Uncharacterized beta-barrel protein YwiB (DUF1934 family) n=1 Tax=Sporosarcina limicola TaxID=34101 RepID=A0A927MJA8_9BACL|nr:DUF1934 family protein [Sporosarcina limicola]MBE1555754.1 uncharacterized beta-barrel protein YwiB (DUF1934 family) [Sporosarcina limicola]